MNLPRIALFTHRFLEPTHIAVAQSLSCLTDYRFHVYAKQVSFRHCFDIPTVVHTSVWHQGIPEGFFQPDLYHSIWDDKVSFRVLPIIDQSPRPYVVTLHGGRDVACGLFDRRYKDRIDALLERANAFTVVCGSHRAKLIARGADPNKIWVIPVGIDPRLYSDSAGVAAREPVICQVARFIEKKGVLDTVDTFRRVLAVEPKAKLLLVGDGPLKPAIEARIREHGIGARCQITGPLSHRDMLGALRSATVYLHPARTSTDGDQEGTPMAILEAQALGLPVVATHSGAIAEIVEDKVTGLLVRERAVADLAAAVIGVINNLDLARALGARARERILQRHCLDSVARSYASLYRHLLEGR